MGPRGQSQPAIRYCLARQMFVAKIKWITVYTVFLKMICIYLFDKNALLIHSIPN